MAQDLNKQKSGGAYKTRHKSGNKFFGKSGHLPASELPTLKQVLAHCELEREIRNERNINYSEISRVVESELRVLWENVNPRLVIISEDMVCQKIVRAYKSAQDVSRHHGSGGSNSSKKVKALSSKLDKLFDLIKCQCPVVSCESYKNCKKKPCEKIHFDCKCDIEYKIPEIEMEFVVDQREKVGEHGKFMMGQVDWAVAKQQQANDEKA